MDAHRRFGMILAAFATATYLALIVCAFGFIALLTDTEPIPDPAAGRFLGPAMVGGAVLVVLSALALRAPRIGRSSRHTGFAILVGVGAWAAFCLIGVTGYLATAGGVVSALFFGATISYSLYAIAIGVLAWLVAWFTTWLVVSRREERERPRWPWERDDDEEGDR